MAGGGSWKVGRWICLAYRTNEGKKHGTQEGIRLPDARRRFLDSTVLSSEDESGREGGQEAHDVARGLECRFDHAIDAGLIFDSDANELQTEFAPQRPTDRSEGNFHRSLLLGDRYGEREVHAFA